MKDQNPFREKLYNHTMPVPDGLWDRIESHLPSKKKRFPFFWFSFATGSLLTGGIIFWLSLPMNTTNIPQDNPEKIITGNAPIAANSTADNPSSNKSYTPSNNTDQSSVNNSAQDNNKESSQISPAVTSNLDAYSKDPSPSPVPKNKKVIQDSGTTNMPVTGKKNKAGIENEVVYAPLSNPVSTIPASEGDEDVDAGPENVVHFYASDKQANFHVTHNLPLADISVFDPSQDMHEIDRIKPDPDCYKSVSGIGYSPFSIDIFSGPGFSPRSFADTGSETSFADLRKNTERNQYAWSAGMRVNYNLNRSIALRGGILYEQIGDIFDYRDSSAFVVRTRVDSFFTANGVFLYADTVTYLQPGTRVNKIHNRYHRLDIPILASYEMPLGRAVIMINAGPVFNISSRQRGTILDITDPNQLPKPITSGEPDELPVYKSNLGLSFYLGGGILLPMGEHIAALIEPRILFRIKPVTLDSYPLEEHRHYVGFNLGLRYYLN